MNVPKLLRYTLIVILAAAVITGFVPLSSGSSLPLTTLLDAWLICVGIASLTRGRVENVGLLLFIVAYSMTRFIPALLTGAPMSEFFRAYRWLAYLVIMLVAVGRSWGPKPDLVPLTWLLIISAAVKYVLMAVFTDVNRPILFLENNFEIPMFFGLIIVTYNRLGKWRLIAVALAAAVALLSQSRSGILAFACLLFFVFVASPGRMKATRMLLFGIPVAVTAAAYVFTSRSDGSAIDRERFLDVFLDNVADWGPIQWLFGTTPLTPLDDASCSSLSYYHTLIYSLEYDTCYSVVLHSFGMRVVYDAGLVGLLLAFGIPLFAMLKAGVDKWVAISLLAVAVTNALSVSSISNPYVALPVLLAIVYQGAHEPIDPHDPVRHRPLHNKGNGVYLLK